jgi:hypothetical protein
MPEHGTGDPELRLGTLSSERRDSLKLKRSQTPVFWEYGARMRSEYQSAGLSLADFMGWGLLIGFLAIPAIWVFPIPVGIFVWLFKIERPFVDVMFLCIPVFLTFPFVGAGIAALIHKICHARPVR